MCWCAYIEQPRCIRGPLALNLRELEWLAAILRDHNIQLQWWLPQDVEHKESNL